jgi:crotonobetainyl-CoA:carnitine CoA-transferase CaiB-like acyl-CoA transferase
VTGPLNHIKVVDVTSARAGPACIRILADLGADVIQVSRPSEGSRQDIGNDLFTDSDRENLHRNKRSIVIDLQTPAGREVFFRLVRSADVVAENFRPDVKYRLGIDYESVARVNERIIYGSISGFGQDGPWGSRPGVDQIAQGMSGLMSITGPPGSGPWRVGTAICDLAAGWALAQSILAALIERGASGKGQWVKTSLLEVGISLLDFQATRWLIGGEIADQAGNDHPTGFPTGVFETADGLVNLSAVSDRNFRDFAGQIGRPELAEDERFLSPRLRLANKQALRAECEPSLKLIPSAEVVERLNSAGIPCGPILRIDQVFQHPQVRHLDMSQAVDSQQFGRLNLVRSPFTLSRTPATIRSAAPVPGEHTTEVLQEYGWSDDEIAGLIDERVVRQASVSPSMKAQ